MDPRRLLSRAREQLLVIAVVAGLLATGAVVGAVVVGSGGSSPRGLPEASHSSRAERTSFLAKVIPPEPENPSGSGPQVTRGLGDLANRLPLERKVAQLFLFGFRGTDLTAPIFSQLRRLDLGGIVIDRSNYTGPQLLGQMGGEALVISQQARHIPPWVMAQQEGGEFSAFPDLPPSGAPADYGGSVPEAAAAVAQSAASLRPLGVTGVLGPVVDVGPLDYPALGARLFSDEPGKVAAFAKAAVGAYNRGRVFSTAGHFPGLGSASQSTEQGTANVGLTLDELRRSDFLPFRAAVAAHAPGIVLSSALYPIDDYTTPASLSPRVATDLLRDELHFRGVAITDDLADPGITELESVPDAAVKAIDAGADMLYISGPPGDQQAAYVAVLRAVHTKRIARSRVDEAVLRILQAKRALGVIQR